MTTLEKLHEIESKKVIYDIHYCRAGVGFVFYDREVEARATQVRSSESWRNGLTVQQYYPTFEEAVDAEHKRLYEAN